MEGFKVETIDTTGAGDSFVGALLGKIVDDHSIIEVCIDYSITLSINYVSFS